jgi:hypothetical protein
MVRHSPVRITYPFIYRIAARLSVVTCHVQPPRRVWRQWSSTDAKVSAAETEVRGRANEVKWWPHKQRKHKIVQEEWSQLYGLLWSNSGIRPCQGSGRYSLASHRGGPGSRPGQSMWDLWWTKWHCDRFFSEFFGFPLSIHHSPSLSKLISSGECLIC